MSQQTGGKWYKTSLPIVMSKINENPYDAVGIADCRTVDVDDPTAHANAEFIVRACNSHDALLAALEEIQATFPVAEEDRTPMFRRACQMMDAAISAARTPAR